MDKNILNNLLQYDNNKDKVKSHITGIGVNNVHKRLQHYFGEKYGLDIKSRPGKGTEVKINLPGESL